MLFRIKIINGYAIKYKRQSNSIIWKNILLHIKKCVKYFYTGCLFCLQLLIFAENNIEL